MSGARRSRAKYWLIPVPLFVALVLGVVALQVDIPLSAVDGVERGMRQADALHALARAGIDSVVPVVANPVVVRAEQLERIPELMGSEGICISDNAGLAMNLELGKDGEVKTLYASDAAVSQLGVVRSRQDVEALLRSALPRVRNLVAGRCTPGARWVSLMGNNEADNAYLLQQPAWRYRRPQSYSWVTLEFVDGRLSRIEYRWQPFEV